MSPPTRLLEAVESRVEASVGEVLGADEEVLIRVFSDLEKDRRFGRQWLVVTPERVLIVPEKGSGGPVEVPIAEIEAVHTESLVGGGQLEIERCSAPTLLVPYSSSMAEKFSEVALGLEQLRKKAPLVISTQLDPTRCKSCNRLLPEKDGICPACISRLTTLKRIAAYMRPYKARAAVLAFSSIATTGAELLPPLITRRIVDDVLVPGEGSTATFDQRFALLGLLVLALIAIRCVSWAAEWVHGWVASWLGAQVTADIRSELYRRLEMLSLQFYDKRQAGALMSRVTRDTGRLQEFLVDGLPYLVINGLMIVGILVFPLRHGLELDYLHPAARTSFDPVGQAFLEANAASIRQVEPGLVRPHRAHQRGAFGYTGGQGLRSGEAGSSRLRAGKCGGETGGGGDRGQQGGVLLNHGLSDRPGRPDRLAPRWPGSPCR